MQRTLWSAPVDEPPSHGGIFLPSRRAERRYGAGTGLLHAALPPPRDGPVGCRLPCHISLLGGRGPNVV